MTGARGAHVDALTQTIALAEPLGPGERPAAGPGARSRARLDSSQSRALSGAVKLLKAHDNPAVAQLVHDRLNPPGSAPTIVVIGEVKRGKSSLVNALLSRPGRSPVGVDVTTGAFLRFVPPTAALPEGAAQVLTADGGRFATDDVASWVTVGGARAGDPDAPLVRGAEVALSCPRLPGVVLIDTPGVGGLDGGHARLAASVAQQASVLLFVCDAGTPLTAPELRFLEACRQRVDSVVFALTKTDLHPAGWREVLAADRELLARHAPQLAGADIVPVSGLLAAEATALPDPDPTGMRDALHQASGLDTLTDVLRTRLADAEQRSITAALRTARSGLDQVELQLRARRAVVAGSAEVRVELEDERARLEELRGRQQRWTHDLERDLGRLRRECAEDIAQRLVAFRDRWTVRIDAERRGLAEAVARQFMAEMSSDLQVEADEVAAGYDVRLHELVRGMFGLAVEGAGLLSDVPDDLRRVRPRPRELAKRPAGLMDPALAGTAVLGAGLAAKIPLAATIGFFNPLALAVGGAWLAVNIAYRAVKAGRVRLQAWMQETTHTLQADLMGGVDGSLRELKPELVVGFRAFLAATVAELDAVLAEATTAARASAGDRKVQVTGVERHLQAVAAQQAVIDEVLSRGPVGPRSGTSVPPTPSNASPTPAEEKS